MSAPLTIAAAVEAIRRRAIAWERGHGVFDNAADVAAVQALLDAERAATVERCAQECDAVTTECSRDGSHASAGAAINCALRIRRLK